jgi:hypothetical protein
VQHAERLARSVRRDRQRHVREKPAFVFHMPSYPTEPAPLPGELEFGRVVRDDYAVARKAACR